MKYNVYKCSIFCPGHSQILHINFSNYDIYSVKIRQTTNYITKYIWHNYDHGRMLKGLITYSHEMKNIKDVDFDSLRGSIFFYH